MMNKKYIELKKENKYQVILLKNGQFYNIFSEDAIIISYMTNYKLFYFYDKLCVSIPKEMLQLILSRLRIKNISYVVVDKKNIEKYFGTTKAYENFYKDASNTKRKEVLLDQIINKLKILNLEQLEKMFKRLGKE